MDTTRWGLLSPGEAWLKGETCRGSQNLGLVTSSLPDDLPLNQRAVMVDTIFDQSSYRNRKARPTGVWRGGYR